MGKQTGIHIILNTLCYFVKNLCALCGKKITTTCPAIAGEYTKKTTELTERIKNKVVWGKY